MVTEGEASARMYCSLRTAVPVSKKSSAGYAVGWAPSAPLAGSSSTSLGIGKAPMALMTASVFFSLPSGSAVGLESTTSMSLTAQPAGRVPNTFARKRAWMISHELPAPFR